MADSTDRLLPVCELLLGAAYADKELHEKEKEKVEALISKLLDEDELPVVIRTAIFAFDPKTFDVKKACSEFADDPAVSKMQLVELIAAVNEADDVHDLDEDDYIRSVAKELGLEDDDLEGLVLSYEVEALSKKLRAVTA